MARELDPQAQAVLDLLDSVPRPPTHALSVTSARSALEEFFTDEDPDPVGDVADFSIPGPETDIPVRLYLPEAEGPHPALVYLHGGGWVLGGLDTHDATCRGIVTRADCAVLSVDYRLAPEHPFPAALEDSYAAVEWTVENGERVDIDTDRVAVGGDSAGGNLTAGVTLMARDHGGPDVAHQVLLYPAVASPLVHDFESYEENGEGYFLETESMRWFYERYITRATDQRNEYAAPLLAADLSGLPPATVVTAEFDPLRDEGREYGDRLGDAGVPVTHHHYDGMIHGFSSMEEFVDAAGESLDDVANDLQETFSS
ncbi:alpha/beta hydrolase [Halomarina ordinaria]|uniref:Alpha/beta hydrolase n=1 Tax=Halomarina ordinaria TaxID=3033939 RepID=A0ABD5U6V0_9EURY|nr:alpha/beta hydrolase [Halomarina sp. PSRA2]